MKCASSQFSKIRKWSQSHIQTSHAHATGSAFSTGIIVPALCVQLHRIFFYTKLFINQVIGMAHRKTSAAGCYDNSVHFVHSLSFSICFVLGFLCWFIKGFWVEANLNLKSRLLLTEIIRSILIILYCKWISLISSKLWVEIAEAQAKLST